MAGWLYGGMDGWMGGWMDGRSDGWLIKEWLIGAWTLCTSPSQIEEEAATPESEDYKILPEDSLDKSTILLEAEESTNGDVFGCELLADVPVSVTVCYC